VPANEVVLDKVMVTLHTEAVGTVRGWAVEGMAGQTVARSHTSGIRDKLQPRPEDRLRQLDELRAKGLLTDEEYRKNDN
jgi:hypothetical protein